MKIKILAGEYLFDEQGHHVLDDRGFALKADAEVDVEILDGKSEQVKTLLIADRVNRGLDADGNLIQSEPAVQSELGN